MFEVPNSNFVKSDKLFLNVFTKVKPAWNLVGEHFGPYYYIQLNYSK